MVWASNHRRTVFEFGPQNSVKVLARMGLMGGGTWRHHEACIEAKQSHEEPFCPWVKWLRCTDQTRLEFRCTDQKLDHFVPGLSGSAKISKDVLKMCSRPINNIGGYPNQPSL